MWQTVIVCFTPPDTAKSVFAVKVDRALVGNINLKRKFSFKVKGMRQKKTAYAAALPLRRNEQTADKQIDETDKADWPSRANGNPGLCFGQIL